MNDTEIADHLTKLSEWEHVGTSIVKEFNFSNFMESMAFVNKIAPLAEEMGHHPDITIEYSKVTLTLSTHDEGGLTQKDFDMALQIDQLS